MNVSKKRIILMSVTGAIMGIGIWFLMLLGHNPEALSDGSCSIGSLMLNIILSAVFGALCMGSSVVYDIEEWGILKATVTHFVIVFASFNLIALPLGWFLFGSFEYWIFHAAMIVGYFLIWLIQYLIYKHKVKELNRELKMWKSKKNNVSK